MSKPKDKYMINRNRYKDIKRYDHQQMEEFLTDVYKSGYQDGRKATPDINIEEIKMAMRGIKGVGPKTWRGIEERLESIFGEGDENEER